MAAGSRERARSLLVKALYQWQLAGHDYAELVRQFSALAEYERIDQKYFESVLGKVLDDTAELDAVIADLAVRSHEQMDEPDGVAGEIEDRLGRGAINLIADLAVRSLDQLDAVGRGILLMALAELKHRPDVPVKVVINEAVKLAKRYGAADSFRFVNAVVDKASKRLREPAPSPPPA